MRSPQSTIRASDVRLRAPRGLLANAAAGEPARLELLAPLMGNARVELPGRMKVVLHLQSPWCDPNSDETDLKGSDAPWPPAGGKGGDPFSDRSSSGKCREASIFFEKGFISCR